ncbi:hypothetical protein LTR70_002201 [Exophiala xenobiotica]|uniref:Uncharacterized protein n=1 Tax=Lithohypha guttulata TaxID=1690604 RepID=A0ABR0KK03_9EURO|nr:hypothetical protein LTR24_002437 [Lithohypha guttulata]KAK5326201.1 hypothetical protein LTR70_002201 [Exophiala xenobiotica]
MPRPPVKRRRQNSFIAQSPKRRHALVPDQRQAREQHEKKLLQKPVGKRPDNSDDSDDIVTSRTTGRNRKRQEIYASGAVAKGDKPGAYPTKAQRTRTIRQHTEEILSQRSRSASRASSVDKENHPKKAATKAGDTTSAKKGKLDGTSTKSSGVTHTSQAEVSVLGKIKPRKRQASILQLIEQDNDGLTINTDDEAEFLPDEVSTPVNTAKPIVPSPQVNGASPLKRKRGSDQPQAASPGAVSNPFRLPQDQLPQPTRAQQRVLNKKQKDQDDVMAPPESSDDESVDGQPAQAFPSGSKKQRQPPAPSTEQLQDLMPSKKLKSRIRRRQQNEFDIPDDSDTGEGSDAEKDHSAFLPSKSRKTKQTWKKPAGNGVKSKSKIKESQKSTRNTSYTPSPARLRTPRPLSSTKSGTQAKSPTKQDTRTGTVLREKAGNTPLLSRAAKSGRVKKQYGGSRLRGPGKENQAVSLSGEPSGSSEPEKEQVQTAEVKAWNKKWGDIDDFALEFEENTASTRSNSPRAR